MEKINYKPMKNGEIKKDRGFKRLYFSPELELRPVIYGVYSGDSQNRGTYQGVIDGDIEAKVTWGRDSESFLVVQLDGSGIRRLMASEEANFWITVKKIHPWLDKWLEKEELKENDPMCSVWIPTKAIPQQEYLSEKIKKEKAIFALSKFGLPYTPEFFQKDKKENLNWKPLIMGMSIEEFHQIKFFSAGSEEWHGSNGNGKVANFLNELSVKEWRKYKFIIRVHSNNKGNRVDIWKAR